MTTIGHNGPPAFEAHSLNVDDLFALVSGSTAGGEVTTDEQEAALDDLMNQLRDARKSADTARADEKRPHDEAAKAVQSKWKPLLDRCDAGVTEIKNLLTPYRSAKLAAKNEATRLAREEAEAKAKAAQEALRSAGDLEGRFAAEEQLKQAQKLTAVANRVDRSATGLRSYQVADVTDHAALLKFVKANAPEALKAWLEDFAQKALPAQLPGVTVRTERRAA